MSAERAILIRFPQHEGRILACRDGRLQLVVGNKGQQSLDPATDDHLWVVSYDGTAVRSVANQAAPNKIIYEAVEAKPAAYNTEGLPVSNGSLTLRLCIRSASPLALELRSSEGCAAAVFVCVECGQIKSSFSPLPCGWASIPNRPREREPTLEDIRGMCTHFDYVIVGTSFCAYAFVQRAVANNPNVRILLLEKGEVGLLKHRQVSPACQERSESLARSEYPPPWSYSSLMTQSPCITGLKGQMPFYGGRSTFWSAWCPEPSEEELMGWPENLKRSLRQYFGEATKLLGVTPANKIESMQSGFRIYDPTFQEFLEKRSKAIPALRISPGPLAMANNGGEKFSTPGPLKDIRCGHVQIVLGCVVEKIEHDGKNKATGLVTSQGHLPLGDAMLILAMSTLPSTTLVLNSFNKDNFPCLANVGKRFTAHFVSSVIARAPRSGLLELPPGQGIQLGAVYIAGKEQAQYHLQLSAAATSKPESKDIELCRKYSANSIAQACLDDSPDHVIISCSALGELDHKNKDNWFKLEGGVHPDLTSNGELQIVPNKQDLELWDTMDDVMFKVTEACLSDFPDTNVEYCHGTVKDQGVEKSVWKTERKSIRQKDAVHDASTMWMGGDEDTEAPVGLDYRLRGVDNMYITGGALWPTGGSWNPVLTIVAMAMHLADCVCRDRDGTESGESCVPSKL